MFPSELTASRSAPLQREGEGEGQEGVGRARLAASALQPHRSPSTGHPSKDNGFRNPGAQVRRGQNPRKAIPADLPWLLLSQQAGT